VRVAAPREAGRANSELLRLMAEVLGVTTRELRIVAGVSSRDKILAIEGLSFEEVRDALSGA